MGVNYRALSDLFMISDQRKDTISYDISVQMIEIYNEQVRDLLVADGVNKRYPFYYMLVSSTIIIIINISFTDIVLVSLTPTNIRNSKQFAKWSKGSRCKSCAGKINFWCH